MNEFESLNWVEIKPLNLAKLTDFGETQEGFKIEMEKELVTITKEEYDYLVWFYSNADFGPADDDVRYYMDARYLREGGKIPEEYTYE